MDAGSAPDPRRVHPHPLLTHLVRVLIATAFGVLTCLAFPPVGWWWNAPLGLGGLIALLKGRSPISAGGLATAYGIGLFVPLLSWIDPVGTDVWLGLAVAQAVFVGATGAAVPMLRRLPAWPLFVAAWWVAGEWVRGRYPLGGFPWGRLGFIEPSAPVSRLVAVGGVPMVSFAIALAGALLAAAWDARRDPPYGVGPAPAPARRSRVVTGVGLAVLGAVVLTSGLAVPLPTGGQDRGGQPTARLALVQGNVPRAGLNAFAQRSAVLRNHLAVTATLAGQIASGAQPRPDLLLWPENGTDIDPFTRPDVRAAIASAVDAVGSPALIGAVVLAPHNRARNASLVWLPGQQPRLGYAKRHLVPFGEYVPMRSTLGSAISRLARVPRDMIPGTSKGAVDVGGIAVGDVICYEVAYDGLVRDAVSGGSRLLVVQTNNATYGVGETHQQLAMARLRAMEHGRSVAVVATSGVSAVVAPDGTVVERSAVFTPAILTAEVPLRDSQTLATRAGSWPEWAIVLLGAGSLFVALATSHRSRRSTTITTPSDAPLSLTTPADRDIDLAGATLVASPGPVPAEDR